MASSYFGIDAHALDDCIIEMEDAVAETASLLSTRMEASEYTEIIEKARQQIVHLSVGTAIDLEQTTVRARELEDKYKELADLAATDGLTGIANRAHFDEVLRETVAEKLTAESGRALGLLILDIDHFKQFNDAHGHPVGDRILTGVADCLRASVRSTDLAARYGGEEFVVILPQTTMVEVRAVADRLRRAIERMTIVHGDDVLHVTASVGGACLQRVNGPDDGPALLALADACLYRAKDTGRNRCVCAEFSSIDDA
jgi:diguanylate cyclase (GGDEF)-like protein